MLLFEIFIVILFLLWFSCAIWCVRPYKAMTWFYHDILGWHEPVEKKHLMDALPALVVNFAGRKL